MILTSVPSVATCAFRAVLINRTPAVVGELGDAVLDLMHHAEGETRAQLFAAAADAYEAAEHSEPRPNETAWGRDI